MTQKPSSQQPLCVSRRALLALGPAGLAAAVAGCTSPDATTSTGTSRNGPADTPRSAAPSSAATSPPATSGASRKLTTTDAVPVGGGLVVSGILVVQPTKGTFKAFDARCPHLAAIVKPPKDGVITCPIHGSKFADTDGSLLKGPANRDLKELAIKVDADQILSV
jgi:Rieske Fe-S protein